MVTPNESRRVRVMIVDDSALMRNLLADILRGSAEIEVVGSARDGDEAIKLIAKLKPDVVTLDVEMPGRTGLEILPDLLAIHDASVIMVSTHTKEGAATTLAALERGAIDFHPKPERNQFAQLREAREALLAKVMAASKVKLKRRRTETHRHAEPSIAPEPSSGVFAVSSHASAPAPATETPLPRFDVPSSTHRCIVIGISTGGPQALSAVLPLVGGNVPPILVVQHMPATFTGVFAERLNRACSLEVKEAEDNDAVIPGRILIAPGGRHMAVVGIPPNTRVALSDAPPVNGHKPSVDVLFISAARIYQSGTAGFIMTGMGRDGVDGCKVIQSVGGITLGQDEATSAVYGMNKAAFAEGALNAQFALGQLPALIKKIAREK